MAWEFDPVSGMSFYVDDVGTVITPVGTITSNVMPPPDPPASVGSTGVYTQTGSVIPFETAPYGIVNTTPTPSNPTGTLIAQGPLPVGWSNGGAVTPSNPTGLTTIKTGGGILGALTGIDASQLMLFALMMSGRAKGNDLLMMYLLLSGGFGNQAAPSQSSPPSGGGIWGGGSQPSPPTGGGFNWGDLLKGLWNFGTFGMAGMPKLTAYEGPVYTPQNSTIINA